MDKKRIFILGAGFSKAAGYPLNNELIRNIINEKVLGREVEKLSRMKTKMDINDLDFDEVLHSVEEYRKKDNSLYVEKYLRWYQENNKNVAMGFLRLMYWYFWHLRNNLEVPRYVQFFTHYLLRPDDVIISFNYDLLIEKAFINPRKEFDERGIIGRDIEYNQKTIAHPMLLKPHGSINWLIGLQPEDEITEGAPGTPVSRRKKRLMKESHVLLWQENNKYIWEAEIYFQLPVQEKNSISPLIKWWFPASDQVSDYDWKEYDGYFKEIWWKSIEELKTAKQIFVIGFAFNEYDSQVRENIINSIKKETEIIVVSSDSSEKVANFFIKHGFTNVKYNIGELSRIENWVIAGLDPYIKKVLY